MPSPALKQGEYFAIIKPVIDMVYVCDNCGSLFSRNEEQDRCPDCGERMVRSANAVEQSEFISRMAELICGECAEEPRFPNLVETEISRLNVFTFKLPATALQIDSGMMVDIVVEYGASSADGEELLANVWAKQADGVTIRFLMPVRLAGKRGETPMEQINRVFAALNGNETFQAKLYSFIARQLKPRE